MFICDQCGEEFTRKDNLKRHQETGVCFREEDPLANLVGQDTKKKIRLNIKHLKIKDGKDYAEVLPLGDIHFGHPCVDIQRVRKQIDYCLENGIYILGMGDYLEAGTRESVGDSVYAQKLNPQDQMDTMIALLKPLADAGLLLGLHIGNHEDRILKATSVNMVKIMAKQLRVPYMGFACWSILYIDGQAYTIYSMHGKSGSRFEHTKLKAALDISQSFDCDLFAMGHVHSCIDGSILVQKVDKKSKSVTERKKWVVITGHYLSYDDSYAQAGGFPIGKMGSPKVKLFGDKHDIHISW